MRNTETRTRNNNAVRLASSVLLGILAAALLLMAAAMLYNSEKIGIESTPEIIVTVNFAGAAVAGIAAAARKGGGAALKAGLTAGIIFMAVLIAAGLIICRGSVSAQDAVRISICSLGGGLFGGALCMKRGNKKLHKKREKGR
jgi:putative membrane protein (TIGR04086 family)